jgi:hypothetical protein
MLTGHTYPERPIGSSHPTFPADGCPSLAAVPRGAAWVGNGLDHLKVTTERLEWGA